MKILCIKALNINSLKGITEINFAELTKDSSLFSITGPTGSGKSTILDIISCALYGRTSRLKNPNDLMSRNCGESYCEVEFEIRGTIYRSSWTQKRARKKYDGTFQTAKMELVDLTLNKILALKSREVPKKIEELSGLDFGRFTQSMLLAQGGFDAFLKADEKERSILLEKITGTRIYADVSIAIFEKHRAYAQDMDLDQKVLESIELLDDDTLRKKHQDLAHNITLKAKTSQELQKLTLSLTWLRRLEELREQSTKYELAFRESKREKEQSSARFERLSLANRALNVSAVFSSFIQLKESVRVDIKTVEKLNEELLKLHSETESKEIEYTTVKKEFEIETTGFTLGTHKLKEAREKQTQERQTQASIRRQVDLLKQKEKNLEIARDTLESRLKEYEYMQAQVNAMQESTFDGVSAGENRQKNLEDVQTLIRAVQAYTKLSKRRDEESKEYENNTVLVNSLEETMQVSTENIETLKKHIITLREKQEKEQLLKKYEEDRKSLVEGEACLLCGSREHPYAGKEIEAHIDKTKEMILTDEQALENKEKALGALALRVGVGQTKRESSRLEMIKLDVEIESIVDTLEQYSYELESDSEVTLIEQELKLIQEIEQLKHQKIQKDKLLIDLHKCEVEKKENEIKVTLLSKEIQEIAQELKELHISLSDFSSKRVEILNVADLDVYEKKIRMQYKALQEREQLCSTALNGLKVKSRERLANKKSLDIKIEADEKKLYDLNTELEELYAQNEFQNATEFQNAQLDKSERDELAILCKDIQERYTQTQTLQNQTLEQLRVHEKEALSDKPIEVLEVLQALLGQKQDALQESIGSEKKELEVNEENSTKHKERIVSLKKKRESFKVWVKLNELVGSADGTKFKKFAQGITLDQLINLANQHLNILSTRYTLARNQDKLLELEIIDAYQGNVVRPVSTLSGGESFIVSLALALGLSELASQKIAIDSLFLDEGFGTLDEESLETALNALNLLQSGGKMVGVISHVEALKERIPLQIKIVPRGDGTSYVEVDH
jgi:exonuclease SbcC